MAHWQYISLLLHDHAMVWKASWFKKMWKRYYDMLEFSHENFLMLNSLYKAGKILSLLDIAVILEWVLTHENCLKHEKSFKFQNQHLNPFEHELQSYVSNSKNVCPDK